MTKSKARKNSSSSSPATSPSRAGNYRPGSLPTVSTTASSSTSNAHRAHTPLSPTSKHSKSTNTGASPLLPSLLPRSEPSPSKITTSPFFMANRFGNLQIDPVQSTNGHESDSSNSSNDSEMDDDDYSSESSNSSHGEEEDESESEDEEVDEPESDEEQEIRPPLSPNSVMSRAQFTVLRRRVKESKKNLPPKQVQRIQEDQRQRQQVAEVQSKQEKEHHHHAKGTEKEVSAKMAIVGSWFSRFFSFSDFVRIMEKLLRGLLPLVCEQQTRCFLCLLRCVRSPLCLLFWSD